MKIEDIGFYTMSDARAASSSVSSPIMRLEILITKSCNFKCPYCRGTDLSRDATLEEIKTIINKIKPVNIRFTGGEPTLHKDLVQMCIYAKSVGVKRIAISTNGSATKEYYDKLIDAGVSDFSISLDSCCSSVGKKMCGGIDEMWEKVCDNIKYLASKTYVTTGMVFTEDNINECTDAILFADSLSVSDIRIVSSAQYNKTITGLAKIPQNILDKHPILKYRVNNYLNDRNMRSICQCDSNKCGLVVDDIAIKGEFHYPCIIYMREHGSPIGSVNGDIRRERYDWFKCHSIKDDPICKNNCLDVCIDYNNRFRELNPLYACANDL